MLSRRFANVTAIALAVLFCISPYSLFGETAGLPVSDNSTNQWFWLLPAVVALCWMSFQMLRSPAFSLSYLPIPRVKGIANRIQRGRYNPQLAQKVASLERANADLESFTYIAAHDLRAPLRTIHELTEWIRKDSRNDLSEETVRHLDMLHQRTGQIEELLQDLLNHAIRQERGRALRDVCIHSMVAEVFFLLDPECRFEMTLNADDATVRTYKTPLRHVLMNIVGNAMQHHDKSFGHIKIQISHHQSHIKVVIEDDGPGMPVAHRNAITDDLANPFPSDEVKSNGNGLKIVQRLLAQYGFSLDIASRPEKQRGSLLRFNFPRFDTHAPETKQLKSEKWGPK